MKYSEPRTKFINQTFPVTHQLSGGSAQHGVSQQNYKEIIDPDQKEKKYCPFLMIPKIKFKNLSWPKF